jgi:hypothetical protein
MFVCVLLCIRTGNTLEPNRFGANQFLQVSASPLLRGIKTTEIKRIIL